jgi:hypothetical protein
MKYLLLLPILLMASTIRSQGLDSVQFSVKLYRSLVTEGTRSNFILRIYNASSHRIEIPPHFVVSGTDDTHANIRAKIKYLGPDSIKYKTLICDIDGAAYVNSVGKVSSGIDVSDSASNIKLGPGEEHLIITGIGCFPYPSLYGLFEVQFILDKTKTKLSARTEAVQFQLSKAEN